MSSHQVKRKLYEDEEGRAPKKQKGDNTRSESESRRGSEPSMFQSLASTLVNYPYNVVNTSSDDRREAVDLVQQSQPDEEGDLGVYPLPSEEYATTQRKEPYDHLELPSQGHVCPFCSDDIDEYTPVLLIPRCGHFFHESCLDRDNVNRCPTCNTKIEGQYEKITKLLMNTCRLLLFFDLKTRLKMIDDIRREGDDMAALTPREFYNVLRDQVFHGKIPKLRNLYVKSRMIHEKPYHILEDGGVDVLLSGYRCRKEMICEIALDLYKKFDDGTKLSNVKYLLNLFEDLYLYLI